VRTGKRRTGKVRKYLGAFGSATTAALIAATVGACSSPAPERPVQSTEYLTGDGFRMSAPDEFRGAADPDAVQALLQTDFGTDFAAAASKVAGRLRSTPGFALFAYDTKQPYLTDTLFITSLPTGAPLDRVRRKYVHDTLTGGALLGDVEPTSIDSHPAVRVLFDDPVASPPLRTVAYLVVMSDTWWIIEYSAPKDRFDALLLEYERSAQTFSTATGSSTSPTPRTSAQLGSVVARDDFSDPSSGWVVSNDASSRTRYVDGAYEVLARVPRRVSFLDLKADSGSPAIDVEIDASKATATTPDAWLGLTCPSTSGHYVFAIDPNAHHYMVARYRDGPRPEGLDFGSTPPGVVNRDGVNQLRASCIHDEQSGSTSLALSVNEVAVASLVDEEGLTDFTGIGVYVSSFRGGTVARFDDAVIRA
jgi:hypothetical protein